MSQENEKWVGFVLLDGLCYSMAAALTYMGEEDGQVMLAKIGKEMFNYLVEQGHIDVSGKSEEIRERTRKFFLDNGLADDVTFESEGNTMITNWKNYRIFDAMVYLAKKGSPLVPCPACLISEANLRGQGLKIKWLGIEAVDPLKRDAKTKGTVEEAAVKKI